MLILSTMFFNSITPQEGDPGALVTVWRSLTASKDGSSPVILVLLLSTWAMIGLAGLTELGVASDKEERNGAGWPAAAGIYTLISLGGALIFALFHAANLRPVTLTALESSNPLANTITLYYVALFLDVLALALILAFFSPRFQGAPSWRWTGSAADVTLAVAALIGMGVERVVVRPIIKSSGIAVIIATLGLASILQGVASIVWRDWVYPFPSLFEGTPLRLGSIAVTPQTLGILLSTIAIIGLLFVFLNFTKIGTGLRAVTQNPVAATLMGIRLGRMYSLSWAIAGALSAVAGILLAPRLFLSTGMGSITFMAIAATVIGGWGNLFGAVVGGYLLGILQTILPLYIPTKLQGLIPFALLLLVLVVRPTGVTGGRRVMKV